MDTKSTRGWRCPDCGQPARDCPEVPPEVRADAERELRAEHAQLRAELHSMLARGADGGAS